ncbi:YndM family protein [Heyndrickxia ginsengihumi]|uniref:YndM family protein n=1 Tax=Heyndrickxia ginsengihumi TaxID=363870 RepID=A0A0A6V9G1_9BACI|nr:YndM family protein [Heyndrickxia ginsengihumi]KHD84216.1 hypothetical protein NG54_17025 [Heyndrickxia ginsengihumi]MBE6184057.1 DUF2512 family protein [Bacillus sp. (in: firmicutes)]MCM3024578.1 YndM family protein [Heyndrickxia ginsengihumi]NEY18787.1 YndM family protein [Heyndrickxia ginsengihumi]
MDHLKALAIKFISSFVILYIILGIFFGMSFGQVLFISAILGIVSYLVGDLMILPSTNNTFATWSDFGLAFVTVWMISKSLNLYYFNFEGMIFESLISAAAIAAFELFFHRYLLSHVMNRHERENPIRKYEYELETTEELTPKTSDLKKDEDETDL